MARQRVKVRRSASGGARKRRKVPNGFKSWKTYMASIRPGGKKAKRRKAVRTRRAAKRSNGVKSTMAKRRRKRSTTAVARRPRRRRSVVRAAVKRYRRRSGGAGRFSLSGRGVMGIAMSGMKDGAIGVAAKAGVRLIRGKTGYDGGTAIGTGIEVVGAVLLSVAAGKLLGAGAARAAAQGAFMAPIETFLKQAKVPYLSSALGDEGDFASGTVIGDGMGAYPSLTGDNSIGNYPNAGAGSSSDTGYGNDSGYGG